MYMHTCTCTWKGTYTYTGRKSAYARIRECTHVHSGWKYAYTHTHKGTYAYNGRK